MRTSGQGFGATDKTRQRYAMTERDDSTGLDHTWWRKYENRAGRWTSPDPYRGSMYTANPQSFNRYSYANSDAVNLVDPTGLEAPLTCLVDGIPVNCTAAFALVNAGAGTVGSGPGFYGHVLVVNHEPTFDGGRLYQSVYYFLENFGYPPQDPIRGGPTRAEAEKRAQQQLPPCNLAGSGDIGVEIITPFLLGPKGGVQLDNKGAYPYFGLAAGTPGKGVAINANTRPVSPGLNIGASGGIIMGIAYSAHIDWSTGSFRSFGRQLKSGTWSFGGTTPGVSANLTVVLAPKLLQKKCRE